MLPVEKGRGLFYGHQDTRKHRCVISQSMPESNPTFVAIHLLEHGSKRSSIQDTLGHQDVSTTEFILVSP